MQNAHHIILTFHGIGETARAMAPGEAGVWLSEAAFVEVIDLVRDRSDVVITFDDGNASDAEIALPALIARGVTADFYIVAGRLDAPGYLTCDQVRELAAMGMNVGSHGMRHRPWRGLSEPALRDELIDAREMLQEVLRAEVKAASCPFGSYDRRIRRRWRAAGFERVYTSDGGLAEPAAWLQPRYTIHRRDDLATIARILRHKRPLRSFLRNVKIALKRWR